MFRAAGLLTVLVLVGCGDPEWVGTYDVSGTWKLSGPFEGGRTVGDASAELLCEKVAGAVPAPSFVEDKLRDWLEGSVGKAARATVDANMPPELAPDGKLTRLLGQTLAAVEVESTLVLEGDDDELRGAEEFTAVEYVVNGQRHRISASQLGGTTGISARWSGEGGDSTLSIARHPVALRYGELVRLVAADLLQASELGALESKLSEALSCTAIVDAAVGSGSGLKISVAGWTHTVDRADLEAICRSAMSLVEQKALGQFELDTRVEVGGSVLWSRAPGQEAGAITLRSGADFGGVVSVVPDAFAPRVDLTFTAESR